MLRTINISIILRLFSKVTLSFVAIEILTFFKHKKLHFYCSRELSVFWLQKWYSLSRKGSITKCFVHSSKLIDWHFSILHYFPFWGVTKYNILIIHQKISYFDFVEFSQLSSFLIFLFYSTNLHHWQGNWSLLQI